MSIRVNFKLLMAAVLFLVSTMTFAQNVPFQVQVVAQVARMRWGPGPTFVVQHYANSGHILTILEVDATSDPPWTWYYARTPSNVESWIRSDLVRRDTSGAAVPVIDNPTGIYPVVFDNLCNTTLFRPCQEGTDHLLWQAGYWAFDRYDTWEHDGRNLDIVFHENPCKADRLCSTREQWDAGLLEAQLLAESATPEGTLTPVEIQVTRIVETVVEEIWVTLEKADAEKLLGRDGTTPATLYVPPAQLWTGTPEGQGTLIGNFRFDRVSDPDVTCQFWHNADPATTDFIKSSVFNVRDFFDTDGAGDEDDDDFECISGNIDEDDVVARQWKIKINRRYRGEGRIRNVSWNLTATHGVDEPDENCANSPCTRLLDGGVKTYLEGVRTNSSDTPVTIPPLIAAPASATCTARKMTEGDTDSEIVRYEHTCRYENEAGTWDTTLKFHFTHDRTRGFLPTPTMTDPNG